MLFFDDRNHKQNKYLVKASGIGKSGHPNFYISKRLDAEDSKEKSSPR